MKEDFLHFIWRQKLFNFNKLKTVQGESVEVLKVGLLNQNAGPDFLNAQLKINKQLWVGTVEIHIKSSDWYAHHHEEDENYDAVILHVVWEHDAEIFMKNSQPLPTLALKKFVQKEVFLNYQKLYSKKQRWIPCEEHISQVDSFLLDNWLERLYFERLEYKAILINELLENSNNDFEAVLFQLLAKNFGLKVNGEAFLRLAQSIDFSLVRKVREDKEVLSALLFGQAGFLQNTVEEEYHTRLKREYEYLKKKHCLDTNSSNRFQFFRMRPANFPTIRLAQFIALYHTHTHLFSQLMSLNSLCKVYRFFAVEVDEFWKTHYTFETTSNKSSKRLTKAFIDLLVINTLVPLQFVWKRSRGEEVDEEILSLLKEIQPEKNAILLKFTEFKIEAKNAFESQALLELKASYCNLKKCLECAIGCSLIKG